MSFLSELGESQAGKTIGGLTKMCKDTTGEIKCGTTIGAIASIGSIVHGIQNIDDYCLSPSKTAENVTSNFLINMGDAFGGWGSMISGIFNYQTPEQKQQKKLAQLNQQYEDTFKKFVAKFAATDTTTLSMMEEEVQNTYKVSLLQSKLYYNIVNNKETIDRIYIFFLFLYIIIIIIYIMIHK